MIRASNIVKTAIPFAVAACHLASSSIIIRMSAIRKLAAEAADNGMLAPELAAGTRQAQALLNAPDVSTLRGLRDRAMTGTCSGGPRRPRFRRPTWREGRLADAPRIRRRTWPVQTTERYLGTKQDPVHAPNDAVRLRVTV